MQTYHDEKYYTPLQQFIPPVPYMPICPILARAYVPYQVYQSSFDINEAFDKGTLFPMLYQPYIEKERIPVKEADE